MPKSMYDEKARERYEQRKERPTDSKRMHRGWLPSIGILSIVSFITSGLTAYSTWIQQTDDIRIITEEAGLMLYDEPPPHMKVSPGNITLMNLGNRSVVISDIQLGHTFDRFLLGVTAIAAFGKPGCWFESKQTKTTFVPIILKAGELSYFELKFKDVQVESDGRYMVLIPPEKRDKSHRTIDTCMLVSYSTVDFSGFTYIVLAQIDYDSGHLTNEISTQYKRIIQEGRNPRIVVQRTRTTLPWLNYLIEKAQFMECQLKIFLFWKEGSNSIDPCVYRDKTRDDSPL
jgi:hypothetical protein